MHRSSNQLMVEAFHEKRPVWIHGRLPQDLIKNMSLVEQCFAYLDEAAILLKSHSPKDEWKLKSISEDEIDMHHIRMTQQYEGIKIYGAEIIFHAKDNEVFQLNGSIFPTPVQVNATAKISTQESIEKSKIFLSQRTSMVDDSPLWELLNIDKEQSELVIYHTNNLPVLCYHVSIYPNPAERWELFVDAGTGEIIHQFKDICEFHWDLESNYKLMPPDGDEIANAVDLNNETQTIHTYETGGTYFMIDASRDMYQGAFSNMPNEPVGTIWTIDALDSSPARNDFNYNHVFSGNNTWGHSREGVSAHFNGGESYNYFKTVHNRESINGDGGNIYLLCQCHR